MRCILAVLERYISFDFQDPTSNIQSFQSKAFLTNANERTFSPHPSQARKRPSHSTTRTRAPNRIRIPVNMLKAPQRRIMLKKLVMIMAMIISIPVTLKIPILLLPTTLSRCGRLWIPMLSPMLIPKPNRCRLDNLLLPPFPTLHLAIRILHRTPRLLIRNPVLASTVIILFLLSAPCPGERGVFFFGLAVPSCPIGA